jgi:peptide/nickel transport system permease protein
VIITEAEVVKTPKRNKSRMIIGEIRRWPWVAAIILLLLLLAIIFADVLTPYSPETIDLPNRLQPPAWQEGGSSAHLLGTDTLGRDLLTRILHGARISLLVGIVTMAIGGTFGLLMGITAGYFGGKVDAVISRIVDSFMALPSLLIAIVFAVTLGPSMITVIIAISVTMWAQFARVIRGEALALRTREFVLQAKVAGCSTPRILLVHILPSVFNTFMILVSLNIGLAILIEASLSFLGAGIPPPTPSWGQMISEGRGYIASAYWLSLFPGIAIALTVLAFQLFGDGLRDRLDPRLRQF